MKIRWLGQVPYGEAWDLQRGIATRSDADYLLLLEHPPVYTLGVNADPDHVLIDPQTVGADLVRVDRGGDVTFHGPGQLVGYPIVSVGDGPHRGTEHVRRIEQLVIDVLEELGLRRDDVGQLPGYPGVWVGLDEDATGGTDGGGGPRKVCAVGVRTARGRTTHGFALNVDPDLRYFSHIVPCGIADRPVTSLAAEGWSGTMADVVEATVEVARRQWDPTADSEAVTDRRAAGPRGGTTGTAGSRGAGEPVHFGRRRAAGDPPPDRLGGTALERRLARSGVIPGSGLGVGQRKPDWLRVRARMGDEFLHLRHGLRARELVTVCEEAGCPNIYECWSAGTATFMINGDRCTRACGFCQVSSERPRPLDATEPERVAEAVAEMGLAHAVVTCVARDDLDDGGADGFAATIAAIRRRSPTTTVEVLISDCRGRPQALGVIFEARPDVLNHNIETVARLQYAVRPSAGYALEPVGAGPGQGCLPHHQVRDHRGHGRADGRGRGHPGRPAGRRCRHRDHRSVPAAERGARARCPLLDSRRVRRAVGHRPVARLRSCPGLPLDPLELSRTRGGRVGCLADRPAGGRCPAAGRPLRQLMEALSAKAVAARRSRLVRVRERMGELGVDALLLSHGADLPWLTGYQAMPLERLTMLVLPLEGEPVLVVPALEAPRVAAADDLFVLAPWSDAEDPEALVEGAVPRGVGGAGAAACLAISDRAWATNVLGLQERLPSARWLAASKVTSPLRAVKDSSELDALRAASQAADRVAAVLQSGGIRLIGRTESEVSVAISDLLMSEGHCQVNFAIVGSGPNAASPHHEPGQRRIGSSETVVCDFGGALALDGDVAYCSDITRTVVTGPPGTEVEETYAVLRAAQQAGVAAARTGVAAEDVDRAARDVIEAAGLGEFFVHRTGHGIGIEEHEDPYLVRGNREPLRPGHAFSVEPGIYKTGRFGMRLEDIVVVGIDGEPEPLNAVDHSMVVVEA